MQSQRQLELSLDPMIASNKNYNNNGKNNDKIKKITIAHSYSVAKRVTADIA